MSDGVRVQRREWVHSDGQDRLDRAFNRHMHHFYKLPAVASWSVVCVCGLRAGGYLASRLPTGNVNPWTPPAEMCRAFGGDEHSSFGRACLRAHTHAAQSQMSLSAPKTG